MRGMRLLSKIITRKTDANAAFKDPIADEKSIVAPLQELIALQRYVSAKAISSHTSSGNGPHQSPTRGRGMDFSEVRHYQSGDEIRHMEWRITARTGKPHIKLYEEERERPVVVLVDFNPSMYFGTRRAFKSYVAAQLASLIAWMANATGDRVGGLVFSSNQHHEITPKSRNAGVLPLLALLTQYTSYYSQRYQKDKPQALYNTLLRLKRVAKPGSLLVLISDFYTMNEAALKQLNRFRNHHDILAFHICDTLELSAPPAGFYPITDGTEILNLDTSDSNLAAAYNKACNARVQHLKSQFNQAGVRYIQVETTTDLPLLVRQIFPRRNRG